MSKNGRKNRRERKKKTNFNIFFLKKPCRVFHPFENVGEKPRAGFLTLTFFFHNDSIFILGLNAYVILI